MSIHPFVVDVAQATLDDLRERLARTQWPDEVADAGWEYGSNLASMRALVEHWRTSFDWRTEERAMNEAALRKKEPGSADELFEALRALD